MSIRLGTTDPSSFRLGNTAVSKLMLGNTEVWSALVSYRNTVLSDNPVAYWRLGESSGTVAVDQMGLYDGTYIGSPTLGVAGAVVGDTAITTSANRRMQRLTAVLSGTMPMTLEGWVRTSSTSNQNILAVGNSAATRSTGIGVNPSGNAFAFSNGSGGTYYTATGGAARTGQWVHVVGVFQTSGISVYVNGSPTSLTQAIGSSTGYDRIVCGAWINNLDPTFGSIDEVAVYSTALSQSRILAHYNARNNA